MLQPTRVCKPGLIIQSHAPATSPGVTVTPGNNVYGAYAQVIAGASVTDSAYEIWININSVGVSGSAKDCLVTIGLDLAGGTSYTDFITDLYASCASFYASSSQAVGSVSYTFPVRIPAGASIGAKATVNNATVGTANVQVRLKCKPSAPEVIRVGSVVRTYGSTPASSSGTALTPGTSAEGAYVSVGTVVAGDRPWAWCLGIGINNATITGNSPFYDLAAGDGTTKRIIIMDMLVSTTTSEGIGYYCPHATDDVAPGDNIYVRAFSVGAPVTGHSAIAYGVI